MNFHTATAERMTIFSEPDLVLRRVRERLPKKLRDMPLKIDVAKHYHRPSGRLPAGGQNYLYDPGSGVQELHDDELFRTIPVSFLVFRIYCQTHEHDAQLLRRSTQCWGRRWTRRRTCDTRRGRAIKNSHGGRNMSALCRIAVLSVISLLFTSVPSRADVREIEELIDELANVSEPGFGFSELFDGTQFLPYLDDAEEGGSSCNMPAIPARSDTLRRIVEQGAAAVPVLIKHLGDSRKTKVPPLSEMPLGSEYDFNRRTATSVPKGVHHPLNSPIDFAKWWLTAHEHTVRVGDLCFVALGQIVNRKFYVANSARMGVNSPPFSKALREAVTSEWGGLTPDRHRSLLIDDFQKPDDDSRMVFRRIGAYRRLAYYYPEVVEQLVLDQLAKSVIEPKSVEAVSKLLIG